MFDLRHAGQDAADEPQTPQALPASGLGRRAFLGLGAVAGGGLLLSACGMPSGGRSSSDAGGPTKLRALFMQQAGYSSDEINAMTAAFTKANPDMTVENTFVAYEALHDKIVISAPAGSYDVVLI